MRQSNWRRGNRPVWLAMLTGALALIAALAVLGLDGTSADARPLLQGTPVCQTGTVQVNIQGFAFSPSTVTVCQGATVRWTNLDSSSHTSTSDTGVWNSGVLAQNASFSFTFNTPGSYNYHCAIHTSMLGQVNVVAAGMATPTATATTTSTPGATPTATATTTSTPGATGTAMATATTTATAIATATPTPTSTATEGPTPTATPAVTETPDPLSHHLYLPLLWRRE